MPNQSKTSVQIGDYKYSAVSINHNGWLLCNGQTLSRTTYSAIFAQIGTSFGVGDGSTTFNLPDFRGRIAGVIGQGTGLTNRTLGQVVGSENVTLSRTNLPDPLITTGQITAVRITSANGSALGIGDIAGTASINNTGGNQPFSNMQPTLFGGNMFIYLGVL